METTGTKTHYIQLDALRYYIVDKNDSGWWNIHLSDYDGEQRLIGSGRTLRDARAMVADHKEWKLS